MPHDNSENWKTSWNTFKTVNFALWTLFLKPCVGCSSYPLRQLQKATHWFFKREQAYVAVSVRTKQEIAIECFNTNSKRCPCSLFFQFETPETSSWLHWCINQWFRVQVPFDFVFDIFTTTQKHTTCIEFLCLIKT